MYSHGGGRMEARAQTLQAVPLFCVYALLEIGRTNQRWLPSMAMPKRPVKLWLSYYDYPRAVFDGCDFADCL